ncbi:MAG: PAS domain-containing sensor histidine kinase [Calditrichaeota bacterium]|nr:PAS domain-containing sensor histidine kinase [Calditrichota bacterium]MBT7790326.1 PAS domain-containing sensor histidine kinase [Calditrichota bacterium]
MKNKTYPLVVFQTLLFASTLLVLFTLAYINPENPTDPRSYPIKLSLLQDFDKLDELYSHQFDNENGFKVITRRREKFRYTTYSHNFHVDEDMISDNPLQIRNSSSFDIDGDGVEESLYIRAFYSKIELSGNKVLDSLYFCSSDGEKGESVIDRYSFNDLFPGHEGQVNNCDGFLVLGTSLSSLTPAFSENHFALGMYMQLNEKLSHVLCLYNRSPISNRIALVPVSFYVTNGEFEKNQQDGTTLTFSGFNTFNGVKVITRRVDGEEVTMNDSLSMVVQINGQGRVNWVSQICNTGGEAFVSPIMSPENTGYPVKPITVVFQQRAFSNKSVQETRIYHLDYQTGSILDSTIITGQYIKFIGSHAVRESGYAGLVRISNEKMMLVKLDGSVGPKLNVKSSFETRNCALNRTPSDEFVFQVGDDDRTFFYNLKGQIKAVSLGSPSYQQIRYKKDQMEYDWVTVIHPDRKSYGLYQMEVARFPFWWFFRYRWSIFIVIVIQGGGGALFSTIRTFRQLKESEERYRLLIQQSPEAIVIHQNGRIVFANDSASMNLCFKHPDDLLDRNIMDFVHPIDHGMEVKRLKQLKADYDSLPLIEERFKTKNGDIFFVEVAASNCMFDNQRSVQVSWRNITLRRIADDKLNEARRLAEKTSRLSSIGVMAGGITHEINQPLNTIQLNADTLDYLMQSGKQVSEEDMNVLIRDIKWGSKRISEIIKHMRAFWIAPSSTDMKSIDLNSQIHQAIQLIHKQLDNHNIVISIELGEVERIFADKLQIEQVVIILVTNAINAHDEAAGDRKWVKIRSRNDGESVMLEVIDNALGIQTEDVDKLFDPLYSTGKSKGGTGLGLAIVKMFVDRFRGDISVFNNEWDGATFQIKFPNTYLKNDPNRSDNARISG